MTLTANDLQQFDALLQKRLKEEIQANNKHIFNYIDITCATKKDIALLEKQISFLPNKKEFFSKMDKWMRAMTDKPAEKTAHKNRHDRTDKRLEKIEKHLGISLY